MEARARMTRWRRILFTAGLASLGISLLPWLGLGGDRFVVPGWNLHVPRFNLFDSDLLYDVVSFPLHLLAEIRPLDDFIYFQGEGRATVRPFVVFLFWLLLAILFLWLSLRGRTERTFSI